MPIPNQPPEPALGHWGKEGILGIEVTVTVPLAMPNFARIPLE
jgi:hypothetical protein